GVALSSGLGRAVGERSSDGVSVCAGGGVSPTLIGVCVGDGAIGVAGALAVGVARRRPESLSSHPPTPISAHRHASPRITPLHFMRVAPLCSRPADRGTANKKSPAQTAASSLCGTRGAFAHLGARRRPRAVGARQRTIWRPRTAWRAAQLL